MPARSTAAHQVPCCTIREDEPDAIRDVMSRQQHNWLVEGSIRTSVLHHTHSDCNAHTSAIPELLLMHQLFKPCLVPDKTRHQLL